MVTPKLLRRHMEQQKATEFQPETDHGVDCYGTGTTMRSHNQIMAELGYEMPVSIKKSQSLWDQLRDEFPCDPILQRRVWAFRVK